MKGIYIITNSINEKVYVGQSKDIKRRFKEHRVELKANKHYVKEIQDIYNKNGAESIQFVVVYENKKATEKELLELEKEFIKKYDSFYNGHNSTLGGKGHLGLKGDLSPHKGKVLPKETREKISAKIRKEKNGFFGKKHKEETKRYLSECQQGHKAKKSKFTLKQGIEIKLLALKKEKNYKQLGEMYNVNYVTISRIARGLRWANLPNDIKELEDMLISIQASESHKSN